MHTSIKNPALGSYEAACLMGIHYTQAGKKAANNEVASRFLITSIKKARIRVYSMLSANAHWHAYEAELACGNRKRRLRENSDMRLPMLAELGKVEQHIEFNDACSAYEATQILRCYHTALKQMVEAGRLVGRVVISHRQGRSRNWIFSRKSCEENIAAYCQNKSAGRPRSGL